MSDEGFAAMTASLRAGAAEAGAPIAAVLEGGYSLRALPRGVVAAMRALAGDAVPEPVAPGALVGEARAFLAGHWPVLG